MFDDHPYKGRCSPMDKARITIDVERTFSCRGSSRPRVEVKLRFGTHTVDNAE